MEDAFKKAVLKFGVPSHLYCDNGAIYSGQRLQRIAGELGFHLIHSRPGMPEGRGKIEKFYAEFRIMLSNQAGLSGQAD